KSTLQKMDTTSELPQVQTPTTTTKCDNPNQPSSNLTSIQVKYSEHLHSEKFPQNQIPNPPSSPFPASTNSNCPLQLLPNPETLPSSKQIHVSKPPTTSPIPSIFTSTTQDGIRSGLSIAPPQMKLLKPTKNNIERVVVVNSGPLSPRTPASKRSRHDEELCLKQTKMKTKRHKVCYSEETPSDSSDTMTDDTFTTEMDIESIVDRT
ncbi:hypothetical protein FRX31_028568, partial [Thalictrum thalictroides]